MGAIEVAQTLAENNVKSASTRCRHLPKRERPDRSRAMDGRLAGEIGLVVKRRDNSARHQVRGRVVIRRDWLKCVAAERHCRLSTELH